MSISSILPNITTETYKPKTYKEVTKPFEKEAHPWHDLKKEQAKIEIDEAVHFMRAVYQVIKDYSQSKKTGTAPSMKEACDCTKQYLADKWDYFVNNKYINDSKEEDCFYNKKLSKDAALLSNDVYKSKQSEVSGWKPIDRIDDYKTGLRAVAYKKNEDIFVAYCGTNDPKDFISDMQMAKGEIPEQLEAGHEFFKKVSKNNPNSHMMVTGHSLGGSLAELVACKEKDTTAITFNSFGIDSIVKDKAPTEFRDNKNIYNYIIEGDPVSNSSKHVGLTTRLPKTAINNHSIANYLDMWA